MAGISTGVSLLSAIGLTLLDDLEDWWDWTSGSPTSAKGVTQSSTGSGTVTIPTSGGKPNGHVQVVAAYSTSQEGHVKLHLSEASTYEQQVNNLPYITTVCAWVDATGRACLRFGGEDSDDYYASTVTGAVDGIHFGDAKVFSKYASDSLLTVDIPSPYLKVTGFTFVVFEWKMNQPLDYLNIYSDLSGTVSLTQSLNISSLNINTGGRVYLDSNAADGTLGSLKCDGLATYSRGLTIEEMSKLHNSGVGLTYPQLSTI